MASNEETVVELIAEYAETWRLLFEYDDNRLVVPAEGEPTTAVLEYEFAVSAIDTFKRDLVQKGEATSLFGIERDKALAAILSNIEQTMLCKPLYRTREEKAAHLLYFVVKDHPFTDGNKRIGALLFVLYLTQQGISQDFDPRLLTALTLLIAESNPANKDLMISLTVNLLTSFAD